jgi:HEAT repeat protein
MTYLCPICWNEIGRGEFCPQCGSDLRAVDDVDYEAKLIRALQHPEPTTPRRVAEILGKRRSKAAVPPLIDLGLSTSDPYVQEAVASALGQIGDPRAHACLEHLSREGALRPRRAALRALELLAAQIEQAAGQGQ